MSRVALVVAGVVVASATARARPKADNMPRGWQWPPSAKMKSAAKACESKLDELGVSWQAANAEGRVVDPIEITTGDIGGITYTDVRSGKPPVMDCQLALALASFAPRLYDLGLREVRFASLYRWSKVRVGGKTKNVLSRHALGIAMDVYSFVDDSGREAVVKRDYKQGDELLLSIERTINDDDDTGLFRTVLTPANDPISHPDHFHIEADPDYRTDHPNS